MPPHYFVLFTYVYMYDYLLVVTDVSTYNQWEPLWVPFIANSLN